MATIRLIPSTSAISNSSYAAIANASNMYANTDSTTHGTFTHNRASTNNTYYGYLRGFNFDAVPASATVTSFTIKIKASATGHTTSTSSSYYMSLINNTTQIGSTTASGRLSTTVTTFTFANGSLDWDTIVGYGSAFGIRIPMRRANSNTADVVSVYGAEIEVTYTVPDPRTITSTLSGNGTISPSGAQTYYDGDEYELTITPTTKTDTVTVTQDGVDVTSLLLTHYVGGEQTASAVLGTYSLKSGGFNGSGASYFQGLVGKGHTATQTTSNYYSSGSGTNAVFQYAISFSNIPSNAIITNLYMIANGHCENASQASEYMCVQLKSGSTELSEQYNFKSHGTSNGNETINATTLPTRSQLDNLVVEMTLGYYGGAINGVTVYLEYEVPSGDIDHYTYTYIVNGNSNIAVTIGSVTTYTVTATSLVSGITISPATQTIAEGASATVKLNDNYNIIVKDNNVDVTSSLVYHSGSGSSSTFTGIPTSYDSANSTYNGIYSGSTSDGLTSHTDSNRICVYANTAANSVSKLTYNFDCSSIPQDAVITSVTCIASAACYSSGQYFSTRTLLLYSGSTAKGTATTITGSGGTRTEHNISGGSWTRAELDNAKIVVYIQRGSDTTQASFSFWGATLTVAYTVPESYYEYTITNVITDHTIVVTQSTTINKIFRKINGSWVQSTKEYVKISGTWRLVNKVYLKINGSWVLQSDKSAMFNQNAIYIGE